MFCKLFLPLLFFCALSSHICQGKDFVLLRTAIEQRNMPSIQTQFRDFFDFWKNSNTPEELTSVANADELLKDCFDFLRYYPLEKNVGLSTAEFQKLTDSEKLQIRTQGVIFAIIAIGYLERNPLAIDFAENLKKESRNSDKFKILFQVWRETLKNFSDEKSSVNAQKITNGKDVLPYVLTILKEQKYLYDTESQYVLNIVAASPEIMAKDKNFNKYKESVINMIEQQFDQLPQDPKSAHEKTWRGQQTFILLHQAYSSPQQHVDWTKKLIKAQKISPKLQRYLEK